MIKWVQSGKASVVVDGQFGSTGKGLASAWLARRAWAGGSTFDIATTAAGAQSGHTTRFAAGSQSGHTTQFGGGTGFICYHLPTHGVMGQTMTGDMFSYLNSGAIIDPAVLLQEMQDTSIDPDLVAIHPRAAIITDECREVERATASSTERTASTQKGVGAALAMKVLRSGLLAGSDPRLTAYIRQFDLNHQLAEGDSVVVEIPQGTDLSLNHGYAYPYVTSRDCTVGAGLSDAGIHPSFLGPVCMVVRTMPIRVGNIIDRDGHTLGTSGPFYPDSREMEWAELPGVEPERTTVTRRVRRIATWSDTQYLRSLMINRPDIVVLNFCNYLAGPQEFLRHITQMRAIEMEVGLTDIGSQRKVHHVYGFGPCVEDVTDEISRALAWYEHREFR